MEELHPREARNRGELLRESRDARQRMAVTDGGPLVPPPDGWIRGIDTDHVVFQGADFTKVRIVRIRDCKRIDLQLPL